ncbi:hypothetical protein T4C_6981 [Trichinella pseudospiralis]|uniref:Uncharacterized protein n=1 Tax=Trichinella pseudospiralis TaxID=6337 RepID=A0A0V1JRL6_TRIPS|nr:hypothetical protein T4C_6981 [Trichinella pseudospiralis]
MMDIGTDGNWLATMLWNSAHISVLLANHLHRMDDWNAFGVNVQAGGTCSFSPKCCSKAAIRTSCR